LLCYFNKTTGIRSISYPIFGGLGLIVLQSQFFFYFFNSFKLCKFINYGLLIIGIGLFLKKLLSFNVFKHWFKKLFLLLMILIFSFVFNKAMFEIGIKNYSINNLDMTYYASMTRDLKGENGHFVNFGDALFYSGKFFLKKMIPFDFEWLKDYPDSIDARSHLRKKYVKDKYYYYPSRVAVIHGATVRNGLEFFTSFLSSVFKIDERVVYNLMIMLTPVLCLLAGIEICSLLNFTFFQKVMGVFIFSLLSGMHVVAYISWPGTAIGVPFITFTFTLIYKFIKEPINRYLFLSLFFIFASMSIYPEGMVVIFIPPLIIGFYNFCVGVFKIKHVIKFLSYFFLLALTVCIPAFILTLVRIQTVMGKMSALSMGDYVFNFDFLSKFWYLAYRVSWKDFYFNDSFQLYAGYFLTALTVIGFLLANKERKIILGSVLINFIFLYIYIYLSGSSYSLVKLIYYHAIFLPIFILSMIDLSSSKRWIKFSKFAISFPMILYLISLNVYSINTSNKVISKSNESKMLSYEDYNSLRKIEKLVGNEKQIALFIPDPVQHMWAAFYLSNNPLVLPNGLGYYIDYGRAAKTTHGDKYFENYRYMLLPGKKYGSIADYEYLNPIWENNSFALIERNFVFFLSDSKSKYGAITDFSDSFFHGNEYYRLIYDRLIIEYFDSRRYKKYFLSFDCMSQSGNPLKVSLLLNGKKIKEFEVSNRNTFFMNDIELDENTGKIELVNDLHVNKKPNSNLQCYKISLLPNIESPFESSVQR